MPANVYWLDEPKIMVAEYSGSITRDDIDNAMAKCMAAIEQHNCHFLVDTLKIETLPKDIFRIGSLVSLINHPKRGWLIFAAQQNVMLKFAVQVLVRHQFRMMNTREEAVAFLQNVVKSSAQPGADAVQG